jgi:hypothetical protein
VIFLHHHGHHESDETPNCISTPAPSARFLFDTNERFKKSDIAVTDSKQTADFLLNTKEARKILDIPVTPSKPTTLPFSIRYKWALLSTVPLPNEIANSADRIPRA